MRPPAIESRLDSVGTEYTTEEATRMLINALRECMEEVANDFTEITARLHNFAQLWSAIRADTQEISERLRLGYTANCPPSMEDPVC